MELNGLSARCSWAHPVVLGLCLLVMFVGPATHSLEATEITLYAVADAYVDSLNPDTNYGSATELIVAMNDQPSAAAQTLIRFDLSSIPANATIQSATLSLDMIQATGASTVMLSVNLCWDPWQENTVTHNSVPFFDGRGQSSVGSQTGWVEWNATAIVMDWLTGYPNHGLAIAGPSGGNPYVRKFASREKGPPELVVTYEAPSVTPTATPATPTVTPTATPTAPTATPTATPTTPTPTPATTPTATRTPTPNRTPTPTPTPTGTPTSCPDLFEPNDSFGAAWPLDPPYPTTIQSYICSAADNDYFSFSAAMLDTIGIRLEQLPKNYDLELYDPHDDLVASSRKRGTAEELIEFEVSNFEGEFRVRVFSPGGDYEPSQPYFLTLDVIPFAPPPPVVVNTTDDLDDGTCNDAHCSLREAFNEVNDGANAPVQFDIPSSDAGFDGTVWTIRPAVLPVLTKSLHLEGTTQTANRGDTNPDGPEIVLDGSSAGSGAVGIDLDDVGRSSVVDIVISSWSGIGLRASRSSQLSVNGCYVGTEHTGAIAAGNTKGIVLSGGHLHHIGGAGAGEGNVISGNSNVGLHLSGTASAAVYGNRIGTDVAGTSALGNTAGGVLLNDGAVLNRIGGPRTGEGNVISGNGNYGVKISGTDTQDNKVYGNRIGTSFDGSSRLGNRFEGVTIRNGISNEIGGEESGRGNLIAANGTSGVNLWAANRNVVAGNVIGTRVPRGVLLGNNGNGVQLQRGAQHNTIGPGNTVSRNGRVGVMVYGTTTKYNTITENSIFDNDERPISLGSGLSAGNENIIEPIISGSSVDWAEGVSCPRCTVEVFSGDRDDGQAYEGTVTALATGVWRWDGSKSNTYVHATATDSRGNTSEYSTCYDLTEPNDDFDHARAIDTSYPRHPSFICNRHDVDFFVVSVDADDVLTAELEVPHPYRLTLYGPDRSLIAEDGNDSDTSLRRIVHTAEVSGDYYLRVDGFGRISDPEDAYVLIVNADPLNTDVRVFLDQGWLLGPAVYKLIPDDDGPADVNYVEVVAEITVDSSGPAEPYVTVEIPGDALGFPIDSGVRDCTSCALDPVTFYVTGAGRYSATIPLAAGSAPLRKQFLFRFAVINSDPAGDIIPSADVRYGGSDGEVVADVVGPPIRLVRQVPVIILTSRHHLYETTYDVGTSMLLLATVTWTSQGPPTSPSGGLPAAIYFVDDYSSEAHDWNNLTWNTRNEGTANLATTAIDELLEDWIEDADDVDHVLIVGDDDVVPFFRRKAPCRGDESDHAPVSDDALNRVVSNDYFLTDNHFGDTNHSGVTHGDLEVNVGRIVGDNASDLNRLFNAGLNGPSPGPDPRAVMASWAGFDLDYAGSRGVLDDVRGWGYSASMDLVDNDDWRRDDLLDALGGQFSLFIHGDHSSPWAVAAPTGKRKSKTDGVTGSELTDAIDDASAARGRPFSGIGGCRTGFTLVSGGVIDHLAGQGFSGVVANAALSYGSPEGSAWYTEWIFNKFWDRAMANRSVGSALRRAKADYAPAGWYCRQRTAVQEITLYGVPWMRIPRGGSKSVDLQRAAVTVAQSFGAPKALEENTFEVDAIVDSSIHRIDKDTAPGFDLVEVEGCAPGHIDELVLPAANLEFMLPAGAEVTTVECESSNPLQLGALAIPTYVPAVLLYPDGADEQWLETPASVGTVPTEQCTWVLRDLDQHRKLGVHVVPVVYEATTRQTTLYEQINVRVVYTIHEPIALTDFVTAANRVAPGETVATTARVVNASDTLESVSTTLRLVDIGGQEVARTDAGPFDVTAGGTSVVDTSITAPPDEGSYSVRFEVTHGGEVVARADEMIEVSAGHIVEFVVPDSVLPGIPVEFSVTYANTTSAQQSVRFKLAVLDLAGRLEDDLGEVTRTVSANGQSTVTYSWEGRTVPLGRYQIVATVTPDGGTAREAVQMIEVRSRQGGQFRRPGGRMSPLSP